MYKKFLKMLILVFMITSCSTSSSVLEQQNGNLGVLEQYVEEVIQGIISSDEAQKIIANSCTGLADRSRKKVENTFFDLFRYVARENPTEARINLWLTNAAHGWNMAEVTALTIMCRDLLPWIQINY